MTQSSIPVKRPNWRLLIPLVMLILAALACDEPYIDPPRVSRIEVDADTPGHAFATVRSETALIYVTYETDDYGQHWRPSKHNVAATQADFPFFMYGETLRMDGREIWSFPRPIFRFFFLDDTSYSANQLGFVLPYGGVSGGLQGDRLYAAMGTEGVLVGRLTNAGTLVDWQITANGMDALQPLPLTITDPAKILGVVAFALLVPPYGLLHGFLLYCLWRYLMPREKARTYAIFTTLFLMLVAAIGTVIWLTDMRTDYFQVVSVVTTITALTGVSLTLSFAGQQTDVPQKMWLAIGALAASLVVPVGVAAIFAGWWAIYIVIFGYVFFRRAYYNSFQPQEGNWRERWLVDRLALETVVVGGAIALALFWGIGLLQSAAIALFGSRALSGSFPLLSFGVLVILAMVLINRYVRRRLRWVNEKLKRDADSQSFFPPREGRNFRAAILSWIAASMVASIGTFGGQMMAYGWFTGLLR